MEALIIVLLTTLVYGVQMYVMFLKKRRIVNILPVEAGSTANTNHNFMKKVPIRVENMQMNPSYEYFKVVNDCMKMRKISSGDIIGVQPLNEHYTIKDIKSGDILLIYLDDNRFHGHKIRVMKNVEGDAFNTYYFKDNVEHKSSEPHAFSTIRGVVKEVYHPFNSAI